MIRNVDKIIILFQINTFKYSIMINHIYTVYTIVHYVH